MDAFIRGDYPSIHYIIAGIFWATLTTFRFCLVGYALTKQGFNLILTRIACIVVFGTVHGLVYAGIVYLIGDVFYMSFLFFGIIYYSFIMDQRLAVSGKGQLLSPNPPLEMKLDKLFTMVVPFFFTVLFLIAYP